MTRLGIFGDGGIIVAGAGAGSSSCFDLLGASLQEDLQEAVALSWAQSVNRSSDQGRSSAAELVYRQSPGQQAGEQRKEGMEGMQSSQTPFGLIPSFLTASAVQRCSCRGWGFTGFAACLPVRSLCYS